MVDMVILTTLGNMQNIESQNGGVHVEKEFHAEEKTACMFITSAEIKARST